MTKPPNKEAHFIATVEAHRSLIYKAATLYTSRPEDREDLVQEIILQLWKSFDSFQERAKRSTWMYRVAMNVALQYFNRSKKQIPTSPMPAGAYNQSGGETNPMDAQWLWLQQQIQDLNVLEKGILMLYLDKKSYAEIAEICGISVSLVGTKLSRIKTKMKQKVEKQEGSWNSTN